MSWLIKLDADLLRQVAIQAFTFLAFFVIVKVFFADKIKEILEKRQELIEKDLTDAKEAKDAAEKSKAEFDQIMKEASDKKADIIKAATEDGKRVKDEIVSDARSEATKILDTARKEIEKERQDAQKGMKDMVVDMSIDAAEKITAKTLDKKDHEKLIEDCISGIEEV